MRNLLLGTALLSIVAMALAPAPASAASSATVTLRVAPIGFVVPSHWVLDNEATWIIDPLTNTQFNDQPGIAGCVVNAVDAAGDGAVDGGDVLDAAQAQGCITDWNAAMTQLGRFVVSVDGLDQQGEGLATWWLLMVNNHYSFSGIDGVDLVDGNSMEFVYNVGL